MGDFGYRRIVDMGRTVTCPVERFAGTVTLPDFLNVSQVRRLEDSFGDPDAMKKKKDEKVWVSVAAEMRLPVILACIQEWNLQGVPEKPTIETFPMTPIADASALVRWLFGLLIELWTGEIAVPNA